VTDEEIRLRCLELAIAQVKVESRSQDLNRVAEIQTWFYDRIVSAPSPTQSDKKRKSANADKDPAIFA